MSTTALAAARLKHQVVAFLRPQILNALAFRPRARSSDRLQIRQHTLLPGLEALQMHVLTDRAVLVAAYDSHAFPQVVQTDEAKVGAGGLEAFAGRNTASRVVVDGTVMMVMVTAGHGRSGSR